jgi:cytochrome c-type biogenesis protein CcmH
MFRVLQYFIVWVGLLVVSLAAVAVVDVYQFDTESQRHRYLQLSEDLRCPKCQNQNLAGSDSQIAGDLRRELHRLLLEGKTDKEIKDYMVARYGDFVLYKPPLQASTLILWGLPVVLLVIGGGVIAWISYQRRTSVFKAQALSEAERSQLRDLLVAGDGSPVSEDHIVTTHKEGKH